MLLFLPLLSVGLLSTLLHAFTLLHTLPWTLTYSDVLVFFPKAAGFPYLQTPIEYPVLTGLFLWAAGQAGTLAGYYTITAAVFIIAAAAIVFSLSKTQGVTTRNLLTFFILTPSLLFFLVYNWDILAVASATAALFFLSRNRPLPAAALLAVGFSFKFYPILFLLPLLLNAGSLSKRMAVFGVFTAVALLINVPVMLLSFDGWAHFYRCSAERMPNFDSVWWFASSAAELSVPAIHIISLALFLAGTLLIFWKKRELSAAQLCLPVLLLFLLTTKVFSPQYTLWLLPFFVLFPPRRRWFYLLEGANLLVLLTILPWAFGQPQEPFLLELSGVFVGVRHAALLLLLRGTLRQHRLPASPIL